MALLLPPSDSKHSWLVRISNPSFCLSKSDRWWSVANWAFLNLIFAYALFGNLLIGKVLGGLCLLFSIPCLIRSIIWLVTKRPFP
jgi:hypothetical protein